MNKSFFQNMFANATSGQVYRFTGAIPDGVSAAEHLTNLYVQAMGHGYDTTVVEIPKFQATVLYSSAPEDTFNSSDFELITDLVPDPIPEPVPEIVVTDSNVEVSGNTTPG